MEESINIPTLADRYKKLTVKRESYLTRARKCSKLTIPTLIPPENSSADTTYEQPNQSIGADGLNNLSAKLALSLLPPNAPFFKFEPNMVKLKQEANEQQLTEEEINEKLEEFNQNLAQVELAIKNQIESEGDRIVLGEALKHLLVGGSVFLVDVKGMGLKYYPLSRFVLNRDYHGNVLEAITTELVDFDALPEHVQQAILESEEINNDKTKAEEKQYTLYTGFKLVKGTWKVHQEVEGIKLEQGKGSYPKTKQPFIALRYTRIDGDNYSRSFIEEYIGDLKYLDTISKAIREATLAGARFIMLVDPNGITKASTLNATQNGGFAVGREKDVAPLQANKYYDLKTAKEVADGIERRLAKIFLAAQAVQRDAERVTAQEIQYMIQELQESLGNLYSILSRDFQNPYLKIKYHHFRQANKGYPDILENKDIKVTITTGIEALGRGNELQKLQQFTSIMAEAKILIDMGADVSFLAEKIATPLGLNISGMFPSKEKREQQQQQLKEAEANKAMAAPMINQGGQMIQNAQKQMLQEGEGTQDG